MKAFAYKQADLGAERALEALGDLGTLAFQGAARVGIGQLP